MRLRSHHLPHTITVRRLRATTPDGFGNAKPSQAGPDLDLPALVAVRTSDELLDDRDLARATYTITLPPAADIGALDEITWQEAPWTAGELRLDGPPRPIYHRRQLHHWEIDATWQTG